MIISPKSLLAVAACLCSWACVSENLTDGHGPHATPSQDIQSADSKSELSVTSQRDFVVIGSKLLAPHADLKCTTVFVFRAGKQAASFSFQKSEFKNAVIHQNVLYVLMSKFNDDLLEPYLPSVVVQIDLKKLKLLGSVSIDSSAGLVYLPAFKKLVTLTTASNFNVRWTLIEPGEQMSVTSEGIAESSFFYENGLTSSDSVLDLHYDPSTEKIATLHKSILPNMGNQGKKYFFFSWDALNLNSNGGFDLSHSLSQKTGEVCFPQPHRISSVQNSKFLLLDTVCDKIYSIPSDLYSYASGVKPVPYSVGVKNGISFESAPFTTIRAMKSLKNETGSWSLFRSEQSESVGVFSPSIGNKSVPENLTVAPWAFDAAGVSEAQVQGVLKKLLWLVADFPGSSVKVSYAVKALDVSESVETMVELLVTGDKASFQLPFEKGETPLFLQSLAPLN